jgi:hypothetical protein
VTINSVPAAVSSWSDVQIVVTVPNTSSGLVVVTAPYAGATVGNPVFTIPGPVIGSITPNTGTSGTQVTIFGSGFGLVQGTSSVSINSTNVTSVISWSSTQIIATVPPGTQTGPVLVNAANGISNNNVIFTVPTPVISGLSPSSGSAGTQVTITGSGFGLTQIGSGVSFTGAGWVSASSWSDTQIVVTVPAGAQTGPVLAKGPTGVSNNNVIFTVPGPVVTSISPASGTVGAQVTIVGSGFGASSSMVQFNGSNAPCCQLE